jgi:hydroxymethylglutaryl-CoA lyase
MSRVFLTECPRDAMQGIKSFIPTEQKIRYIQSLLRVGFDVLDFGSFVSPKAVPQMRDTHEVVEAIDLSETNTKLLSIVANTRGAEEALRYAQISFLGYPFSISENFQMRNTNKTIQESLLVLSNIAQMAAQHQRELVVYLSMGFGNPYGDPWSTALVSEWISRIASLGIRRILLSDTVGVASPERIQTLFTHLIQKHPEIHLGAHLHAKPVEAMPKIKAAFDGGCRHFDGAIRGLGGCPMAKDELTGNVPTEKILTFIAQEKLETNINLLHFESAFNSSLSVF